MLGASIFISHIASGEWGFVFLVRIGLTKTLRRLVFDPSLEDKHFVHNAHYGIPPMRAVGCET